MNGTVAHINPGPAMVAILTADGDYSIFEVIGGEEFQVGDAVSWREVRPLGGHEVINHRTGERADVYFQNHCVTNHQLREQLLY